MGSIADIAYQRGTTTRRCGSAARSSCRSTSGSVTPARPPSPGARSPTSPTIAGRLRRGAADPPRGRAAGLRAARRHPRPPRSPGARSPTSPTSAATTTRRCGSAARSSCRSMSGSVTPAQPPSPGAGSPTSPTSAATTMRRCGSAARSSCRSTSGSATPARPPSPGADRRHRLPARRLRRGAADPPRGRAAGLRAARRHPLGRRHLGQDRRHRLPAGRLRRGAADPPRGRAAGLRAARRHPVGRGRLGQHRRHRLPARGITTRRCGSAARCSCRSTSGSVTPGRSPSPGAGSPTSPTSGAITTRRLNCSVERLEANQQLGDLDGIAAASWDLARIDLAREDYESAFPRLAESFRIFGDLQRPDGLAAVGLSLGQLLMAAGQRRRGPPGARRKPGSRGQDRLDRRDPADHRAAEPLT